MLFNKIETTNKELGVSSDSHLKFNTNCYFNESLEFIVRNENKIMKEFEKFKETEAFGLDTNNKELMLEATNVFSDNTVNNLGNLLTNLNDIWFKFLGYYNANVNMQDAFLNKYAKKFLERDLSDFQFHCFKYEFRDNIPNYQYNPTFLDNYNMDTLLNLTTSIVDKEISEAKMLPSRLRSYTLDNLRPISAEEYYEMCFRIFRNGAYKELQLHGISQSAKKQMVEVIKNFKKDKSELEMIKNNLMGYYSSILKILRSTQIKSNKVNIDNVRKGKVYSPQSGTIELSKEDIYLFNKFIECKLDMCSTVMKTYNICFSAKLDAYTERYDTYKSIIKDSLGDIAKYPEITFAKRGLYDGNAYSLR